MTSKPEGDGAITVGPQTRVSFIGVTLIALLSGLCMGAWSASTAFWKLVDSIDKKLSVDEFQRWTQRHQRANRGSDLKVEVYIPPSRYASQEEEQR